ncbi:hypothetical protein DLAC_10641 [Tieghemostelium lacteum]|uniref:RNase III domain-containing protein n=1 Tax=Tieghemostelium lacteum TaxID=361077 RepID=A0A151Z4F0_TIELA|nr:hypothetical protein DLAC_10641 [Tieghemostelium lacteum]|eukprot:KYQ88839.1 hypothetical protein DLAC_10641 [Tieghemostelium lacteum]
MNKHFTIHIHSSISNILQQQAIGSCFKPVSCNDQFEKLEFMGDSYLNNEITKNIFQTRSMFDPHYMTELRSFCTKNETLSYLYDLLNLEKFGNKKERQPYNDDKTFIKNKADIVEAMIGELCLSQNERCKETLKDIISLLDYIGNERFVKSKYHQSVTTQALPSKEIISYKLDPTSSSLLPKTLTITPVTPNKNNQKQIKATPQKQQQSPTHKLKALENLSKIIAISPKSEQTKTISETVSQKKVTFTTKVQLLLPSQMEEITLLSPFSVEYM